ncbi:MAG TPA: hypothetical protein VLA93_01375 [Pyrinomonadaceae bacterium]|nr:hypothetical protein [Pyrinomonadaceae bacterium]
MKERSYNRQLLKDYLFSALSAEETERLDGLSFTDDRFVQELRAVEDDLVDAYVREELEARLRTQFETRYLSSPLRQEKVAFAKALHHYELEDQKPVAQRRDQPWALRTFFPRFLTNRGWQWTFAAVLLVLIGLSGWLIFQKRRVNQVPQNELARNDAEKDRLASPNPSHELQPQLTKPSAETNSEEKKKPEPGAAVEIASITLAPQVRSETAVPAVSVKSATGYVAVRLDLEPNEYSTYRVELLRQSTREVLWRANNLSSRKHDGDQTVNVRLPAGLLGSESYVLRVSGLSKTGGSELISDYRFRVVK